MNDEPRIKKIIDEIAQDVIDFAVKLVQTKSMTCSEEAVAELVASKMHSLSYDKVNVDPYGNVIGQLGSGKNILFFDSHMDTVAVNDGPKWKYPPFGGEIHDGKIYGRGAVDMKCPLAASVYGGYIAKQIGIPDNVAVVVSASCMEEDYDGEAVREYFSWSSLKPNAVVICEPTDLKIATGHRGRALIEINMPGKGCHASTPRNGINPVYLLAPVIKRVEQLCTDLAAQKNVSGECGSVAISNIYCNTASNNSVPMDATIILDRRLVTGEDKKFIEKEMDSLVAGTPAAWKYSDIPGTSWTGMNFMFHSFLPAWDIDGNSSLVKAAAEAYKSIRKSEPVLFHMGACTNGVATAGMLGLPTIVFGPGDISMAHATDECCDIQSMLDACCMYAQMAVQGKF